MGSGASSSLHARIPTAWRLVLLAALPVYAGEPPRFRARLREPVTIEPPPIDAIEGLALEDGFAALCPHPIVVREVAGDLRCGQCGLHLEQH